MGCLCCLKTCTQLYEQDSKDEPIIDIEAIIKHYAWKQLVEKPPNHLKWWERLCPLSQIVVLEVDKAFLEIVPKDNIRFDPPPSSSGKGKSDGIGLPSIDGGKTVLFQSRFENNTSDPQSYSFRTERQTRSFVELSLQRGFTVGTSLEVDAKIPKIKDYCEVSGKLGGQVQWSFSRGQTSRKEEQITWSVDNNILVGRNMIGTASLMVNEYQWSTNFTLPCIVRALPQPRPTNKSSGAKTNGDRTADKDRGGGESGSEQSRPKSTGGRGAGEGCDDTRDYSEAGSEERDRRNEEEEEEDEIEKQEEKVLTAAAVPEGSAVLSAGPRKKVTPPKILVFVRRKADKRLLKIIEVGCAKLVTARPDLFRPDPDDPSAVICDLMGRSHVISAARQRVRLDECEFAPSPAGSPEIVEENSDARPVVSYRDRYFR